MSNQISIPQSALTSVNFTALTPVDGDIAILQVDSVNGVNWTFRYNAGSSSTYKWEFYGGPPLVAIVDNADTLSSNSYAALGTAGPTLTLPRAGDYDVRIGYALAANAVNPGLAYMSYDVGGTSAVDADAVIARSDSSSALGSVSRDRRKTSLTAGVTLTSKYKITAGQGTIQWRFMFVTPVRVS